MSKSLDRFVYLSFHLTSGEHGMDGIEGRSLIISFLVWGAMMNCSSFIHKSRPLDSSTRRNSCLFASSAHFFEAEKFLLVSKVHMHYPTGADTTPTGGSWVSFICCLKIQLLEMGIMGQQYKFSGCIIRINSLPQRPQNRFHFRMTMMCQCSLLIV